METNAWRRRAAGLGSALLILFAASNASSGTTTYGYDALGRMISVIDANGATISYQYDAAGNRIQVQVSAGSSVVATNDALSVVQTQSVTFDPRLNDSGAGTLSLIGLSSPSHGIAIVSNGASAVTYTPSAGYTGGDSFTYTISNGSASATATVNVTIASGPVPNRNFYGTNVCGGSPSVARDKAFDVWGTFAAASYFGGASGSVPVVTANQAVAPDGTTTADLVVFDRPSSTGWSLINTSCAWDMNVGVAALSFYIKAMDSSQVGKILNAYQGLDTNPPTPLATVVLTSDWQWVTVPIGHLAGNSVIGIGLMDTNYVGVGSQIGQVKAYLWGAQLLDSTTQKPYAP